MTLRRTFIAALCLGGATFTLPTALKAAPNQGAAPAVNASGAGAAPAASSSATGSIDAFLARLKDKDPTQVANALRMLGLRGDPRAFRPIIDTLAKSADPEVRAAGLVALEKLNYTAPFLLEVLRDPGQPTLARTYAAFTLGQMQSTEAVPALIEALASPEADLREKAIDALARIKDMRAWKPLIVAAHKDPSPTLRVKAQKAAEGFAAMGSSGGPDPDVLVAQLKDPDPVARRTAAQALSRHGNWWSIGPLIEALSDADPEVRRFAARALGDRQDRRAVEPLVAFVSRSSGAARHTALAALAVLKDDTAVDPLLRYLADPDPETRKMTARALAALGSRQAGAALSQALSREIIPENRRELARAIGLVKEPRALPALQAMVKDDLEANQIEAIRAMGKVGSLDAMPMLIRLLDDRNPILGVTAVYALRELGAAEAVPALEQVARRGKDAYLREEALQAAVELKGQKQRSDAEKPR